MNALEQAENCMERVKTAYEDEVALWIADAKGYAAIAAAQAAIAQAAAAERQAAALERIADALDIMAHPNRIVAPDRQDYHQKEDYLEAVTQYDYAKNSRPGESMDEYKTRSAAEPY